MEPLHPIFWGQGMFLQPQHFQQQDRYHEARVRRSLHWLAPLRGASNSWCSVMPRCRTVCDIDWDGTFVCFQGKTGERVDPEPRMRRRAGGGRNAGLQWSCSSPRPVRAVALGPMRGDKAA